MAGPIRLLNGNELRVECRRMEDLHDLCARVRDAGGGRLGMIACSDERGRGRGFVLRYVFDLEGVDLFLVLEARLKEGAGSFPSIADLFPSAGLWEREVNDMFGLVAEQNEDRRPLVLHDGWPKGLHPLRKDFRLETKVGRVEGEPYRFLEVEGEGVSEIPVGPIHAGVIEPGHFRFSTLGETILNLETRLFYTHRGVEKLAESVTLEGALLLSERISGDECVANSTAYCQAIERMARVEVPRRARETRTLCAEMERIYNHLGTLAGITQDTGFAYGSSRLSILKERMMRLNEEVSGSRLLFGVNRLGGVGVDFSPLSERIKETVRSVGADCVRIVDMLRGESSVMDRLSGTGAISRSVAADLRLVGVAARSSGVEVDSRRDHPYAAYPGLRIDGHHDTPREVTEHRVEMAKARGDVLARFDARAEEVSDSARMMIALVDGAGSEKDLLAPVPRGSLEPFATALGWAESHRGQTLHWVMAGEDGDSLARYKVRTASSANWPAIEVAVLNDIVADFPLVNKSLDLSYAGNDL
jgi:Ni,Fe-hydrogenase III large subunit/Ni,Fe-hydrogenase III component G